MSEPQLGMEAADEYLIQPLANQPDASQATPSAPPPVASVTPVQQGKPVSNPYRMGGARKPAYSTGGVPAFATTTVPLPPQPLPQPPPTSVPYHVPMQTTSVPQVSDSSSPQLPAALIVCDGYERQYNVLINAMRKQWQRKCTCAYIFF